MRNQVIFQDYEPPSIFYEFSKSNSKKQEIGIMTSQFSTNDIAIETIIHNADKESIEVQADSRALRPANEQNLYAEQDEQVDKRLLKYLKRMEPIIKKQIDEALNQKAYQTYEPQGFQKKQESKTLYNLEDNYKALSSHTLSISDLSWNSAGMVVAAALSQFTHHGSCSHRGLICTWSIFKRQFKENSPQVIETPGCINCLSFHPVKPSLLACGTYSGQILLYDLAREDDNLIARSRVDDYFHRDVIGRLIWWEYKIPGSFDTIYNLLSLGSDGKILLWDMRYTEKHKKQLLQHPIKGFLLLRKKDGQVVPVGGISMQPSHDNKNLFTIGSEGGSLLRATISNILLDMDSKSLLDRQNNVKFPNTMYPFMLNLIPQNMPEIKYHVEQYCTANKLNQASMAILFQSKPDIRKLFPNAVNFVYEPMSSPVLSLSSNKYGVFIANSCQGSSRVYCQGFKKNIENIDGGYQIKWITSTKLAGFFEDQWLVFDWFTGDVLLRVGAPQGIDWRVTGELAAVAYDRFKLKIVLLGSNITETPINQQQKVMARLSELKGQ